MSGKAPSLGPKSAYYKVVHADDHLMEPGVRYGSAEPRIATPPLRNLTPETSWGFSVIEFASDILGVNLMPWQRALLLRALELRPDGSLRFTTVIGEVARQSGKSKISQILSLWGMFVRGWPLVLGTAQDLSTAEEVWEGALGILQDDEELAPMIRKVMRVNGQKSFTLNNGSRYLVKAANRSAGRGLSGQLIIMDELREQRNWNAYSAISKIRQAQTESLVIGISNAGDISSVVLRHLRNMAHAALGDPDGILGKSDGLPEVTDIDLEPGTELYEDDDTLAIFEWSAPPNCDIRDRDAWAQANPALGWRIQERTIASDARTDPEWVFRTEVLCQWSDTTLDGPFPTGSWEKGTNEPIAKPDGTFVASEDDRIIGDLDVCIDVSTDRSMTYIAVCGGRKDGIDQAGVVAYRTGTDWVKSYLMTDPAVRGRVRSVTGQWNGAPVTPLIQELAAASTDPSDPFTIPVVEWKGADLMGGCAIIFDAVRDVTVRHNPQPILDAAAATAAMKSLADGFVFDRKNSFADVAPLMAFTGALWLRRKRRSAPAPAPLPPTALDTHDDVHFRESVTGNVMNIPF